MDKCPVETFSIIQTFLKRASLQPNQTALLYKDSRQCYQPITWSAWADFVKKTALGLYELGVRRDDRIGILSENRPEWTYADLGTLSLGAVLVPIYPTSSPEDIAYILNNAGVKALFVSIPEQLIRIAPIIDSTRLTNIILFQGSTPAGIQKTMAFNELLKLGAESADRLPSAYSRFVSETSPEDLATLIYTSGTTGPPKGVMLTNRNFMANFAGAETRILVTETDTAISFLPLSHVFERLAGYYFMAFHGAVIAYAENMNTVADDMQKIRPTVVAAVPRFYEKFYAKVMENVQAGPPLKKKIFDWAVRIGRRHTEEFCTGRTSLITRILYAAAKTLVFNKIKQKLGGNLRFFISGGAPLPKELGEFFFSVGILILEGYGLTETSPVIAVNAENDFRFGTVGKVLPNLEVKIAGDGEIIVRGPSVMKGYFNNEQATAEVMKDGWFHTGDIGEFDAGGFLKITDRKKDIIATSGGKKVSPQNLEAIIMGDKLFSQVVVLGDKRNYLVALVVLNKSEVENFAREKGFPGLVFSDLTEKPEVIRWVENRFHERIKNMASYEQVKAIAILKHELTQESGELTPTLKVKRKVIMEKYRNQIDALYGPKPEVPA